MDELLNLQMPHSAEAEQAVLGAMLIDEGCIPAVIERLQPEDFYLRHNREIYTAVYTMFNRFLTIDPVTVLDELKKAGAFDENTSAAYLRQLMEVTPTAANVIDYADIVKDKALLRRVGETAGELIDLVRSESGSAQQILEIAEQRIYAIRQGRGGQGVEHISTVLSSIWEDLKERQGSASDIPGISTGLIDLDRRIAGLNPSDLLILAARPGMGKTSLALNIALEAGKHSGKSVVVFSLEMSRQQLGQRLISSECFIDNKKLLTGRLDGEEDWRKVALAVTALSRSRIYIDDDSSQSVADMNAKCRRIKDLGLVIIDYLQLMTSAGGTQRSGDNRQQVVSDISRSLKLMAKELQVPVLCLSQLSRANETRSAGQRRPMLSDLRESGAIEQDADIVMFIYREDYYDEDTENRNIAECIVAKNRHGETGTVELEWRPEFTTFRNLTRMQEDY